MTTKSELQFAASLAAPEMEKEAEIDYSQFSIEELETFVKEAGIPQGLKNVANSTLSGAGSFSNAQQYAHSRTIAHEMGKSIARHNNPSAVEHTGKNLREMTAKLRLGHEHKDLASDMLRKKSSIDKVAMVENWGRELARRSIEKHAFMVPGVGQMLSGMAAKAAPAVQGLAGRAATALYHSNRAQRAAVMGLAGAGAGAMMAGKGHRLQGAAVGGAVGAGAGALPSDIGVKKMVTQASMGNNMVGRTIANGMEQFGGAHGAAFAQHARNAQAGRGFTPNAGPKTQAAMQAAGGSMPAQRPKTMDPHVEAAHKAVAAAHKQTLEALKHVSNPEIAAQMAAQAQQAKYPAGAPHVTNTGTPAQAAGLPNKLQHQNRSKTQQTPFNAQAAMQTIQR